MTDPRDPVEELVAAIERYLELHPEAADTAAGIADWWLFHPHVGQVLKAIERLEACGVMQRVTKAAGEPVFRRS